MKTSWFLLNLLTWTPLVMCRDFYLGMFKKNDFLVAQDVVYKAASHFGYTTASYGRLFKCPITYFRVVDRLGMGRGPSTSIVRGGLRSKYIAVRIKSTYKLPISVNIYVGCENKRKATIKKTTRAHVTTTTKVATTTAAAEGTTIGDEKDEEKKEGGDDEKEEGGDDNNDNATSGTVDPAASTTANPDSTAPPTGNSDLPGSDTPSTDATGATTLSPDKR